MEFSSRIRELRKERGLKQQDIADMLFIDKTTVSKWEVGANFPNQNIQNALADFFGVTVDYLLGRSDSRTTPLPSDGVIEYPVIGSVRAGMGCNVVSEETGDTRLVAASAVHGHADDYFVLRVRGDSMYPEVLDGDCVLVRKMDSVESGSMAVVLSQEFLYSNSDWLFSGIFGRFPSHGDNKKSPLRLAR